MAHHRLGHADEARRWLAKVQAAGKAPAKDDPPPDSAQKMARLGIIAMALCRPVDFRPDEVPSLRSLVSGLLKSDRQGSG